MTPTLQQMTPPPPKEPAFVCIYGPSGVGKTTDCGYSFPTGLFLAAPGALKPLRSVCGYDPASAAVEDIEQATALVRKAAKSGQYDSIIVDDLSFLAEKTFAKTEKKASGFRLWGILRDIVLDFRDACRLEAKCHVIVNCWEQVPTQKQDGTKVRGGPLLSGKLPEQLPAMCDKVYRASHDPNRKPWPSIYRCFLDPNYVMKDRDGIVDPAPMNLSEIMRDGGYIVRRHPSLEWQEGIVEDLAQAWITLPYEQTIPSANAAYGQLMSAGIHPLHVRWTIRDAMDRTALRRARASKFANFI